MTKTDLTSKLKSALNQAWDRETLIRAIECIRCILPVGTVDWEPEESWATISDAQGRVAFVWKRGPFALVDERCVERLRGCIEQFSLVSVPVDDWDAEVYSVETSEIDELFEEPGWDHAIVNPREMSALQLWYATVN